MPRLGTGMPIVAEVPSAPVLAVQDFFWLNDISGELTPIHTASRTNLVVDSEGFQATTNATLSNTISPDGTLNGLKINETTSNSQHYGTSYESSVVSGTIYTVSFYIKKGTYDLVKVYTQSSFISASINITFSTESTSPSGLDFISGSNFMEDAGNGWYRVGFSATANSTGAVSIYLPTKDLSTYVGDISQYTEYWGVQLEQDSRVSAYIPTSGSTVTVTTPLNDTHNAWDYDSANLTLEEDPDSEGSWERPPNVVLNHDFADLSVELVNCVGFDCADPAAVWNEGSGWGLSGGKAIYDGTGGTSPIAQYDVIEVGKTYRVSVEVLSNEGSGSNTLFLGGTILSSGHLSVGTHVFYGATNNSSVALTIYGRSGEVFEIGSFSAKEVDPNDRWSTAGGWSIEGGKAVADGSQSTTNLLYQDCGLVAGNTYTVSFSSNRVSGALFVKDGSTYSATTLYTLNTGTGPVVHEFNITKGSGSTLGFYAYSYGGSIDNITVTEYAAMPLDV